jgi:hypothetical protein
LRRDPVLFPALEAGRVTFAQADEIRRAPAHLRQTLVDRAIHDGLPSTDIRGLVVDARLGERRSRSVQREEIVAKPQLSLEVALDVLLEHGRPSKRDRKVLLQIREVIDQLLSRSEHMEMRSSAPDEDQRHDEQVSDVVLEGAPRFRRSRRRAIDRAS